MKFRWFFILAALPLWVRAEEPAKITVKVTGSTIIRPTALDVALTLHNKGPDIKSVLAAIQSDKDKALAAISKVSPEKEIKEDSVFIVEKNQRQQMQINRGRLAKAQKKEDEKPEVEMQQVVHVRIPLKGTTTSALLIEAEELKTKITAAKPIEEKKPDEDDSEDRQQASLPLVNYLYYAPDAPQYHESACASALNKAKENAAIAAKTMGKSGSELCAMTLASEGSIYPYSNNDEYDPWNRGRMYESYTEGYLSRTPEITIYAQISAEFLVK